MCLKERKTEHISELPAVDIRFLLAFELMNDDFPLFFMGNVVLIFFSFFPVFAENRLGNLYLNSFHTCPDDSARFDVFFVCLPEKLTNHTE